MCKGTLYLFYKKTISLLLLSSLFLHCACRLGITTFFYLNQPYIAQELCINRFEPASACEGSCYLNEMLNKVEKEKSEFPEQLHNIQEILLYYFTGTPLTFKLFTAQSTQSWMVTGPERWDYRRGKELFKPPRLLFFFPTPGRL